MRQQTTSLDKCIVSGESQIRRIARWQEAGRGLGPYKIMERSCVVWR
jgi:hypothetical protein